jgi:hypothetical protein
MPLTRLMRKSLEPEHWRRPRQMKNTTDQPEHAIATDAFSIIASIALKTEFDFRPKT